MDFIRKNLPSRFSLSLIVTTLFMTAASVFADTHSECEEGKLCNPIPNIGSIDGLILKILEGVIKIGIPIIALAIIYCGFLFVAARGKPEAIKKAKDALIYTLIGAAVLLGAWAIAQLISETVLAL